MNRKTFNDFCAGLPHSQHAVQWGGADVWKVGDKVFAVCGWNHGADGFSFKVGEAAYEFLTDQPGIRPAPYMAARGLKWVQHFEAPGLSDQELCSHIRGSYDMVFDSLTLKLRASRSYN